MVELKAIAEQIRNAAKNKKLVFVSGNFNIIHPGHLRLLNFAASNGKYLVVGVNPDSDATIVSQDDRLESIRSISVVNHAFILNCPPQDFISILKPDIVVKGKEFENKQNPEQDAVCEYGGKLIFGSGDIVFSSTDLIMKEFKLHDDVKLIKPQSYLERHGITKESITSVLSKFSDIKAIVIGDSIIDEYITCQPLGISQEDPTIVVTPLFSNTFLGGAGIVSGHLKGLGANVSFFTITGADDYSSFVSEHLEKWDIKPYIFKDETRVTTLKKRYRAGNKTLLRVNSLKAHGISKQIQSKILRSMEEEMKTADLLVFSDFSYGCLPASLVEAITAMAKKYNVLMSADSQTSSQSGDITRFSGVSMITPTEVEARGPMKDYESGLVVLCEKIRKKTGVKDILLTMGAEGVLIHTTREKPLKDQDDWATDKLPALNESPKDVAGAGDSMLSCASLALASGSDIWHAAYLGSVTAGLHVTRVGNTPITMTELMHNIEVNFK